MARRQSKGRKHTKGEHTLITPEKRSPVEVEEHETSRKNLFLVVKTFLFLREELGHSLDHDLTRRLLRFISRR